MRRVRLGSSAADGGVDEAELQDLLFRFPGTLPIPAIDAAYAGAVPVCRELSTPAGYVDALYVNSLGRLTLAEFKLWRNQQARREVIGQILDYAKEFASWGYEDLQREVSKRLKSKGNVLYDKVRAHAPEVNEAEFVGDGIREDVEHIVEFVQRHSGLHFSLALVEAALYRDGGQRLIVQPRVLARTGIIRRTVVEAGSGGDTVGDDADLSDQEEENLRFWQAVLQDYSFADVTVEVPALTKQSNLLMTVRNSANGLRFAGFLQREPQAVRIYEEIKASIEELRGEMREDLRSWDKGALPRIGSSAQLHCPLLLEVTTAQTSQRRSHGCGIDWTSW